MSIQDSGMLYFIIFKSICVNLARILKVHYTENCFQPYNQQIPQVVFDKSALWSI